MIKYILFFLFFFPLLLQAQLQVRGKVRSVSGNPVEGVNIKCLQNGKGASTDKAGCFRLSCELPAVLEFSHVSYIRSTVRVEKCDSLLIVTMEPQVQILDEVVVRERAKAGEILVSRQQIEKLPALLGENDVLKYLATMPGIASTNALDPGIYVRGGNSTENAFLVHDMEVANPNHLSGILSTFDPYILNRSTVYKSGFPARYNDYLSSYINMSPLQGNKEGYEGEVTVGLLASAIKAQGPLVKGHTSFAVSARASYLQHIADLYNKANGGTAMPSYSFYDVSATLDSRLSERWSASAFGLFTTDQLRLKLTQAISHRLDWHTFSGQVRLKYVTEKDVLSWQLGGRTSDNKGSSGGQLAMESENRYRTVSAAFNYMRLIRENLRLSSGLKMEHAVYDLFYTQRDLPVSGKPDFNIYRAYSELNYDISPDWTVSAGINYQYYQGAAHNDSWNPRVKVNYSREGWNVWVDYAKTVQYLTLYTFFTIKSPVDAWYPLQSGLEPAVCRQYSMGADKELAEHWYLYAALFYKDMQNLKDFAPAAQNNDTYLTNRLIEGTGNARGMELDLIFHSGSFYFRANYTLSESVRRFSGINGGREFKPPFDMKHNLLMNASVSLSRAWTINALWTYTSGCYTTFPVGVVVAQNINNSDGRPMFVPVYKDRYNYKLPDNHRLDISADYLKNYAKQQLKVSFGAYNVYNQQNPAFVYFEPEAKDKYYTQFVPRSKVLLPFIPYVSVAIKWKS